MFSVITNKQTKGTALMELFKATGETKKPFFLRLEMIDVYNTGDTTHIDTIFKFFPQTRQTWVHRLFKIRPVQYKLSHVKSKFCK
jgi:hypothetical protein